MSLRNRCGAFAVSQTFAVTFLEDFGVLCGREMRCLMTTARWWKQEHLARFLFVPIRWVEQSVFAHWQILKSSFFCFMGKFKCIYNNIFFPSFDLLTHSNCINIRVWFLEVLFSIQHWILIVEFLIYHSLSSSCACKNFNTLIKKRYGFLTTPNSPQSRFFHRFIPVVVM